MPAPFLSQTQGPTVNEALLVTQAAYQLANPQSPPTLGAAAGFRCSLYRPGLSGESSEAPSEKSAAPSHLVPGCVASGETFCLRHKSLPDLQSITRGSG